MLEIHHKYCTYCTVIMLVTIFLYIDIFLFALKKERQIASLQISNVQRNTNFLHERKSTRTMAIILGVFCAAWIPALIFYSVVFPSDPRYFDIQNWINIVYYLNASLNPYIYCVRSANFRKTMRKMVKSCMIHYSWQLARTMQWLYGVFEEPCHGMEHDTIADRRKIIFVIKLRKF